MTKNMENNRRWGGLRDGAMVGAYVAVVIGLFYAVSVGIASFVSGPVEAREFLLAELAIFVGLVIGGSIGGLLAGFAVSRLRTATIAAFSLSPLLFLGLLLSGQQLRDAAFATVISAIVLGGGIGLLGWHILRW